MKTPAKNNQPVAGISFRCAKAIILLVTALAALIAGIYKGGEGLFFGVVFAIGCGLLGVLYLLNVVRDNKGSRKTGT